MCFKAALFLCAGAVIHASEDQDMRRYGGLQLMPSAAIVASASLAGWPLLPFVSFLSLGHMAAFLVGLSLVRRGVPSGGGETARWMAFGQSDRRSRTAG